MHTSKIANMTICHSSSLAILGVLGLLALGYMPRLHRLEPAAALAPDPSETLLVFTQPADTHFVRTCLPQLRSWAAAQGIRLDERMAAQGVPAELTATPAVVYYNQRGRSIYAGRYAEFNTLTHFVRTHRTRPQQGPAWQPEQAIGRRIGRATLLASLKITPLEGALPEGYQPEAFAALATSALLEGLQGYEPLRSPAMQRTDRTFYFDLHPYRDAQGQLFVSLALFSPFNCIRPVFSTPAQLPLTGTYAQAEACFRQAGQRLAQELERALVSTIEGDAWTPLALQTPVLSWAELGYDLATTSTPTAAAAAMANAPALGQLNRWTLIGASVPGSPILQFRFAEPLARYAGEIPTLSGELQLGPDANLRSGKFVADMRSLTMGMAELDEKVKRKYIAAGRYPQASFAFELPATAPPLRWQQSTLMPVQGQLSFMGYTLPLEVQAELTPYIDEQGLPCLAIYATFSLRITEQFGIQGPDGPEPARQTMLFDLNLRLQPHSSN